MQLRPDEFTWSLGCVIARLGQDIGPRGPRTLKWMRDHVAGLIANAGFPYPLPDATGSVEVRASSRWPVPAVEAWFAQGTPPGAAAAIEAARAREAADDLDASAARLAAGRAARGLKVIAGGLRA